MKIYASDKRLQAIEGGVCAPLGFSASATYACLTNDSPQIRETENIALILSKCYCRAACVFLGGKAQNVCTTLNQKHLKMEYARGIFLNGEIAFSQKSDVKTIERVCFEVGKGLQVPDEEVLVVSCGKYGRRLSAQSLVDGVKKMLKTAGTTHEHAENAARAISKSGVAQTCAYEFDLGNYPYKIGALFAGETATTCVLTTDVHISTAMLDKALHTAVKDTLALLQHEGESTPNSMVCILASGAVGNYCIAQEDIEYDKFLGALERVLDQVTKRLASACGEKRVMTCVVKNTQSKRVSRAMAKGLSHAILLKERLQKSDFPLEEILGALCGADEHFQLGKMSITITSQSGEFLLYEDGRATAYEKYVAQQILGDGDITITVDCKKGNYASVAYGGF